MCPFNCPELKDLHQQLQAGWNVFISVVAINAYTTTRVFAVGLLTNNTLTGFYSIAERIANAVQTFPLYSFTQAIFPRLSKIFHKNKMKAFEIMHQVQLITVIISLIFLPLIFMLAPIIVKIVCGGTYPAAILSLKIPAHLGILYQLQRFSRSIPFGLRQNRCLLKDTYHHGHDRPAFDHYLYLFIFLRRCCHGNCHH